MIDVSLDLETFSSDPRGAAIATIGLVATDFATQETQETWEFYRVVDDWTGIYDPTTVRWHALQEHASSNIGAGSPAVPLSDALDDLAFLMRNTLGLHHEGRARLWSHATFDAPQLAIAFVRCGKKVPWFRRNTRDLRTLYDLAGMRPPVAHEGKHDALHDARAQLEEVRLCLKLLRHV